MGDPLAQWEAANQVVGPHAAVSALKQAGAALAEAFQQARTLYLETLRRAVKAEIENKRLRAAVARLRDDFFFDMEGAGMPEFKIYEACYVRLSEALAEIEKEAAE